MTTTALASLWTGSRPLPRKPSLLRKKSNQGILYAAPSYTTHGHGHSHSHSETPQPWRSISNTSSNEATSSFETHGNGKVNEIPQPWRPASSESTTAAARGELTNPSREQRRREYSPTRASSVRNSAASLRKTSSSLSSSQRSSIQINSLLGQYQTTVDASAAPRQPAAGHTSRPTFPERKDSLRRDLPALPGINNNATTTTTTRTAATAPTNDNNVRSLRRKPVDSGYASGPRIESGSREDWLAWGDDVDELIAWVRCWGTPEQV